MVKGDLGDAVLYCCPYLFVEGGRVVHAFCINCPGLFHHASAPTVFTSRTERMFSSSM